MAAETLPDLIAAKARPGESLRALAARAGIAYRTLMGLKGGEVRSPHLASVTALAKALGVPPARVSSAIEATKPRS